MKISIIKGCVCYVKSAGKLQKSNRKIYDKQTAKEKCARAENKFYDGLPKVKHTKKRVYHLHRQGLID
jgi:hypothetical protein